MEQAKSRDQFIVECLYEEYRQSPNKFREQEQDFIKCLAIAFTNDPDYKLSDKQLKWLEDIWTR